MIAIDRETIISLHKKSESNLTIATELQTRGETVWKVVKKFRETSQTSNRPGQGGKRTVRTKRMVKATREKLSTSPSFGDQTGRRGWNQPDFDAPHP